MAAVAHTEAIVTRLIADTKDWTKGLSTGTGQLRTFERSAASSLTNVAGAFSKVGAALGISISGGALAAFARHAIEAADKLGDAAAAAGISVEKFQGLRYAVSFAGVSAEEFSGAMQTLVRTTGMAISGNERAIKSFRMLGIDARENAFRHSSQEQILRRVTEALATYGTHADRAAGATRLLGESGAKFAASFEQGLDVMDELERRAPKLTDQQVRLAAEVADNWDKMWTGLGVVSNQAFLEVLAAVGNFKAEFSLEEIRGEIEKTKQKIEEARSAFSLLDLLPGNAPARAQAGREGNVRLLEERLRALQADLAARERAELEASPEHQAELRNAADRAAREERERERRVKEEKAAREKAAKDAIEAKEKELDFIIAADKREAEERNRATDEQIEHILRRDKEAADARAEQMKELRQLGAETFADLATNGEEAWDRLKQRALAAIAEIAIAWAQQRFFETPGEGAPAAAQSGAGGALGALFSAWAGNGYPMHARGGSPMVGRAALVGESGPELFVPRTAGTIVPAGRFDLGGGRGGATVVNLAVDVSVEPGMSVTQQRRRDMDGQERVRIAVRHAVQEDGARRGGIGRMVAAETGQRQAPRRGIS